MDIGAAKVAEGERPSCQPLLDLGLACLTAFEPNPTEIARLRSGPDRRYLPHATADGTVCQLNCTRQPGFVSILQPDRGRMAAIETFASSTEIFSQQSVATQRLDDVGTVERIDVLKIDPRVASLQPLAEAGTSCRQRFACRPRSPSCRSVGISRGSRIRMPPCATRACGSSGWYRSAGFLSPERHGPCIGWHGDGASANGSMATLYACATS